MKISRRLILAFVIFMLSCAILVGTLVEFEHATQRPMETGAGQPALTVAVTRLQEATFPTRIVAYGDIAAWQEASIGTEADGLRLVEIRVNVGDQVKRGQLLARFAAEPIEAEFAYRLATVAEAQEALVEASANGRRARSLQKSGALSAQQIQQYFSAERMAQARLDAAKAMVKTQQLRLEQTRVLAPDDGVISSRTATQGAVLPAGQELFRLIRGGRIEWRAEVSAAELERLKPGVQARVTTMGEHVTEGQLRALSPMIDTQTRNGLAYVDLPSGDTTRVGMFARGEFDPGDRRVLTLPQSAVQIRDGFNYVMRVSADSRVIKSRVSTGQRFGDRIEIIDGLESADRVVSSGIAFLGDGDLIRVVDEESALAAAGAQPNPAPQAMVARGGQQ